MTVSRTSSICVPAAPPPDSRSAPQSLAVAMPAMCITLTARAAAARFAPTSEEAPSAHDDAELLIRCLPPEVDTEANGCVSICLHLNGRVIPLDQLEITDLVVSTVDGLTHIDLFDARSRRLMSITIDGSERAPLFVLSDVPAILGLPGGTYDLPRLAREA